MSSHSRIPRERSMYASRARKTRASKKKENSFYGFPNYSKILDFNYRLFLGDEVGVKTEIYT